MKVYKSAQPSGLDFVFCKAHVVDRFIINSIRSIIFGVRQNVFCKSFSIRAGVTACTVYVCPTTYISAKQVGRVMHLVGTGPTAERTYHVDLSHSVDYIVFHSTPTCVVPTTKMPATKKQTVKGGHYTTYYMLQRARGDKISLPRHRSATHRDIFSEGVIT